MAGGKKTVLVDYDGTMCIQSKGHQPADVLAPIGPVVRLVQKLLQAGHEVIVFTARASIKDLNIRDQALGAVRKFCRENYGEELAITCCKNEHFDFLIDDKAVAVSHNEGKMLDANGFLESVQ